MFALTWSRKKSLIPLVHLLIWMAYYIIPVLFTEPGPRRERYMILSWFFQSLMALCFYYNYLFLIPRFFLRKKFLAYFIFLALGIFVIGLMNSAYVYATYTFKWVEWKFPYRVWGSVFFPLYPSLLFFALSSTIRLVSEWIRNERQKKEMEAEKLASELAFLKSQINPHFLFNTLNNICSLARKKSDETEEALIKLSQIMRYMLEDSASEKVSLDKEIEYLRSFIELQRMRLSEIVKINFTIEGDSAGHTIEPMLLIPFVENAFKHGVSYQEPGEIRIILRLTEKSLLFKVENNIPPVHKENADKAPGTGLKNVMRRLELLYPATHLLEINEDGNRYIVTLQLQF
jgi:sensor histidine kinase YesM